MTADIAGDNSDRVLVVGIGNIFMGDDAFGCEVAQQLLRRSWPERVRVVDHGIRGLDVAYALMDGYGLNILIDAMPRGGQPGDVYLVEPDLTNRQLTAQNNLAIEGHSMDPVTVLRMVSSLGGQINRLLVVGCEPSELGSLEEGQMGLSPAVAAAIDEAIAVVQRLVDAFLVEERTASSVSSLPLSSPV